MSETEETVERHPTDEPDGTPAFAASLRAPGQSVPGGETDDADQPEPDTSGGYDTAAVSGDSEVYRPD